jgi:hypothetical protein
MVLSPYIRFYVAIQFPSASFELLYHSAYKAFRLHPRDWLSIRAGTVNKQRSLYRAGAFQRLSFFCPPEKGIIKALTHKGKRLLACYFLIGT